MPSAYVDLLDRAIDVAAADDRIRALWVSGSAARGVADAGSDLDLLLAVADDRFEQFADAWREWLESLTPTLLARAIPGVPGSFYSLTVACLRLDVVAEPVRRLPDTRYRRRTAVFDKDGISDQVPAPEPGAGPDPGKVGYAVEEFLRRQAIFPAAVVARRDWLLGVVGVMGCQQLLYDVFVEVNQPLPPTGVKQWSAKLTPEQRELLGGLPNPQPDRESVIDAMRSVVDAFRTAGRAAAEAAGVRWPDQLDCGVQRYFEAALR